MGHVSASKDKIAARIKRIVGQVAALERSVAADAPCSETLHLAAAVRGAVVGLMDELVKEHLFAHVAASGLTDEERIAAADELSVLMRRHLK